MMKQTLPIIGITMGDPVGIGPEITLSALCNPDIYQTCNPLVIGDINVLNRINQAHHHDLTLQPVSDLISGVFSPATVNVLHTSLLDPDTLQWGHPTLETGKAMVAYIMTAIDMAMDRTLAGVVTGPINKKAMHAAGFSYSGHTEIFAERTQTSQYAMMLAGDTLRVVLVTIHIPFKEITGHLSKQSICDKIGLTHFSLKERFGLQTPRIAVAGLNPHAGEEGLFGSEETDIISPAVAHAKEQGIHVSGPVPPDTVFYQAAKGQYDAVICMYHDQGLIPFKLMHFENGVNTTLGLPIIRTSVDHGTAYDIAGTGQANPKSLIAAIKMAAHQAMESSK